MGNRKHIAILHFLPVEGYPPVQNFLQILLSKTKEQSLCLTTSADFNFQFHREGLDIYRLGVSSRSGNSSFQKIKLYASYFLYNIFGVILLLSKRPKSVIYFESISSFPAIVYKYLYPNTDLYIHYHEYTSLAEYATGTLFIRLLHGLEKKIFQNARGISHTNKNRLDFFTEDHQLDNHKGLLVIPNYPPLSWSGKKTSEPREKSGKLIYVGFSLSFDSMYSKEIIDYVASNSELSLDFYLFQTPGEIKTYADSLNCQNITWNPGVNYYELPHILEAYDIGLILYKGLTINYEHNAPNKLFEYLACGLEVWCSEKIKGVHPYLMENENIKMIDFLNITSGDYRRVKRIKTSPSYNAEQALEPLIADLIK